MAGAQQEVEELTEIQASFQREIERLTGEVKSTLSGLQERLGEQASSTRGQNMQENVEQFSNSTIDHLESGAENIAHEISRYTGQLAEAYGS